MPFDRTIYFDNVRHTPFGGALSQDQVDGQNFILAAWEDAPPSDDLRWLAYALATTFHETAATMLPIEEYGKGQGQPYGVPDPVTGQTYYGRGFVQLTWRDNYARADRELGLDGSQSCEWHAHNALDPQIAAEVMFRGMAEGWFRHGETLGKYFNATSNDPYGAREIINGDKAVVPSWSGGVSIGHMIEGYHYAFLDALEASEVAPAPVPEREAVASVTITIAARGPVTVTVIGNDGTPHTITV
jgi:putative chitinase